jgi:hypothetical protein
MSAVAEKPVSPLGSFLKKIEVKPVAKSEPVVESKVEVKDDTTQPIVPAEAATEKEAVKADPAQDAKADSKVEEKPKDDKTEKRLKDAQTWGNEEHKARLAAEREAQELKARLERIEQKLDGTYKEPDLPSAEQVAANADVTGRIRASHKAAVRQYGLNFVMETVWNKDSPYQELQARDPRIRDRVMNAEDPVLEAIDAVNEDRDGEKYGRTPKEIRERMEAELAPKLKQEILDGLKTKPGPAVKTLGNSRGGTERTEQKNGSPQSLDFRKVFPWGASRI